MKKLVILESPYNGDVERNIKYARAALEDSVRFFGEAPIASHLLYTQCLDESKAEDRQLGIDAGLAWHRVCDYAVFYIDLGYSAGMLDAQVLYRREGIKMIERRLFGWPVQTNPSSSS